MFVHSKLVVLLLVLVACVSASPKRDKHRSYYMNKFSDICDGSSDIELCEASMGRCRDSLRRGMKKDTMMMQDKKNDKKKHFQTCIEKLNLESQLDNFKNSLKMGDLRDHGGRDGFYVDTEDDDEMKYDSETDRMDNEETDRMDNEETDRMDNGETDRMDNGETDRMDNGETDRMDNGETEGDMKRKNEENIKYDRDGNRKTYGYNKMRKSHKGKDCQHKFAKRFLDSLGPQTTQEFKCCIGNMKGTFVNGVLDRESKYTKISAMIRADPTVLQGFKTGINECPAPDNCDFGEFKKCVMKSCIEEVLDSLKQ